MAKKDKQTEVTEDFSFGNIAKANKVFEKKKKKEISEYRMNMSVSRKDDATFKLAYRKFLSQTEKYEEYDSLKSFFRLVLQEFILKLKKEGNFEKAPKDFVEMVRRKGRRANGSRTLDVKDKVVISLGMYSDDTEKLFDDIMYSLAKKEKMHSMLEYSINYFFFDIADFMKENIDTIIENNK